MLKFVLGSPMTGKTSYILDRIIEKKSDYLQGKKAIILVPEQATLNTERLLLEQKGNKIGAICEVLSFKRLFNKILLETGGLCEIYADQSVSRLIMSCALSEVQDILSVYGESAKKIEFLDFMLDAISELKSYNITPQMLSGAVKLADGGLKDKLHDLEIIYEGFNSILSKSYKDPRDILTVLKDKIQLCDFFKSRDIYLDSFFGFTPQEFSVINAIMERCREMTVVLTLPENITKERGVFALPYSTKKAISVMAEKNAIDIEEIYLNIEKEDTSSNELRYLEQNLFKYTAKPYKKPCKGIKLYSVNDIFSEIDLASSVICSLIREEGYRYSDIAIFARDITDYSAVIEAVFNRHKIPFYMDKRRDILTKPVIMTVLYALEIVGKGFPLEGVLNYFKTGFTGIECEYLDVLENYVLKWNIQGNKWLNDFTQNPIGFSKQLNEEQNQLLNIINQTRKQLIEPLINLKNSISGENKTIEICKKIYKFMVDIKLPEQIMEYSKKLERQGEKDKALEYSQLWEVIISALDNMAIVTGERQTDILNFTSMFRLLLSGYDVGTIPLLLDSVAVGSADRTRVPHIKCVILLGVNEGVFPRSCSDNGLFTSKERQSLSELGISLYGNDGLTVYEEQYLFYQAAARAAEKLFLLVPKVGLSGEGLRPSYMVKRITELFPNAENVDIDNLNDLDKYQLPYQIIDWTGSHISDKNNPAHNAVWKALSESNKYKKEFLQLNRAQNYKNTAQLHNFKVINDVLGENIHQSASSVERFSGCRFSYFLRYMLHAKEREAAKFEAMEIGTFVHYILERLLSNITKQGLSFCKMEEKCLQNMIYETVEKYMDEEFTYLDRSSARFKYLFNRLVRVITDMVKNLQEEFSKSSFVPVYFELPFNNSGKGVSPFTIRTNSGEIAVSGVIDRVDKLERDGKTYLRVIDYKTGSKAFNLYAIQNGIGIQLPLYLHALMRKGTHLLGENAEPAAMLYLKVQEADIEMPKDTPTSKINEEITKKLKMDGLVLNDVDIVLSMEKGGEGKFIPVKVSGNEIKGKGQASKDGFIRLFKHVEKLIEEMAYFLYAGDISIEPCILKNINDPCEYCPYSAVCCFDPINGYNKFRKPKKLELDVILKEEELKNE